MVEMRWYAPYLKSITCADSSKVELLKKDLQELLAREPNMRAVVYSQFLEQLEFAHEAVKSLGLKTYVINGSKTADQRDKAIREFQSLATAGPAVLLVTLKAGSVGITLHAASHVFLLEPFIDPATEVQAAGRIHRLGQTKRVGVTKYVFEDSCEANVLKLHEKVHAGELEYTSGILSRDALLVCRSYHVTADGDWKRIEYTDLARENSHYRFFHELGLGHELGLDSDY
jgi:superfamily II DNA/RNA helicase